MTKPSISPFEINIPDERLTSMMTKMSAIEGHFAALERPEPMLAAIRKFVAKVYGGRKA